MNAHSWKRILARQMPLLGHRNWIGIVDSAYPWQTATGVETVATGAGHLVVLKHVLQTVARAKHVRCLARLDSELNSVPESAAPGIDILRKKLFASLESRDVAFLPHDQTIAQLDKAASLFRVLILKSTLTLPYTSVFLELDCGYWSAAAEQNLRTTLSKNHESP
jgi:hypothetical protein